MMRRKLRRAHARTGLNALKAQVRVRGLHAIDKRTSAGRALLAWRSELRPEIGGSRQPKTSILVAVFGGRNSPIHSYTD